MYPKAFFKCTCTYLLSFYFLKETASKAVDAGLPSGIQHATSESNTDHLVHLLKETLDELKGH